MDQRIFWVIVEAALDECPNEPAAQEKAIKKQLFHFDLEELVCFQAIGTELMNGIYTSDIWAAAFVIYSGCSDDEFKDFRGWLIGQGEQAYMQAVSQADAIYDILQPYDSFKNYRAQMSLDLLVYEVVRRRFGLHQEDFKNKVKQLLNQRGFEPITSVDLSWGLSYPESLRLIIPRLMEAYWDESFWGDL